MDLSMKWLSDYVELPSDLTIRSFAEGMTMSGSKVEGYEEEGAEIDRVVVGTLLSVEPHPDSDHLLICQVDVGGAAPIQIVTGAQNVHAGAVVPVALDGSTLPGSKKIKRGKLRGVESNGMLCSLSELGLAKGDFPYAIEDGIFLIEEPCRNGQDIRDALGLNDTSVEFEITSNRPDCLSVRGLAQEASATFDVPLNTREPVVKGTEAYGKPGDYLSVEIRNTTLCPRYIAGIVKNVKIAPSPRWMRERLRASGVRPINNLVDITNYVMLEYGHPMHAFDLRYVEEGKIIVRNAEAGETITTLDGTTRTLAPEMLVIADGKKPVAVAGVMGGEYSGIMPDTDTVVFEAACFDGVSVRTTAKALGMRTDASSRFEKGLDAQNALPAILRAFELVEELGAGEVVRGILDADHSDKNPRHVRLEPAWTNAFLGVELSEAEMIASLEKLGFRVENGDVIVPSVRVDVAHKADIAEEIARIYGYNRIPVTAIRGVAQAKLTTEQHFERKLSALMQAAGCTEVQTYSFISPKYYDKIRLPADSPLRRSVTIANPLGEDTSVMRTTTLPSMLEVLARNYNNRNASAWLYELGTEYLPRGSADELPDERLQLTVGLYGDSADFFTLKGMLELLFTRIGLEGYEIAPESNDSAFHSGRCAVLSKGDTRFGTLGEIHPLVLEEYGIGIKAYAAKLDMASLLALSNDERKYRPLPKFPAVTRDLCVICDESIPVATLEKAIREAAGSTLENTKLFDVYKGEQVGAGKKSVAFSLTLRSPEATLTDEQADAAVKRSLKALSALGAVLRA